MNATVQKLVLDVAKTSAGIVIAKSANIPDRLDLGDSFAMRNLSNGILYYGISDLIEYLSNKDSSFLTFDPMVIGDEVLFYFLLSLLAEITATDDALQKILSEKLNMSSDISEAVVEGVIISTGRYVADMVMNSSQVPDTVKMLRHPLSKIMGKF